jgi:hypothetical protein
MTSVIEKLREENFKILSVKEKISLLQKLFDKSIPEMYQESIINILEQNLQKKVSLQPLKLSLYKFEFTMFQFQLALWILYFFLNQSVGIYYGCAKGFGLNLRVITFILYLSMLRTTLGLFNIPILLNNSSRIHSFFGKCTLFHICGHIFFHYLHHHSPPLLYQITGYIMLIIFLIIGFFASNRKKNSESYHRFEISHRLYLLWLPIMMIHIYSSWSLLLQFTLICVLFLSDRLYDRYFKTQYVDLSTSYIINTKIGYLIVPRFTSTFPGAYYRLSFPGFFPTAHPFSLAGPTTSKYLHFFIEKRGDWTQKLYLDITHNKKTILKVVGPYVSPTTSVLNNLQSSIVCIATGIGITPFFSVIATKEIYESSSTFETKSISNFLSETPTVISSKILHLIWILRDPQKVQTYIDYILTLVKNNSSKVQITLYITSLNAEINLYDQLLYLAELENTSYLYLKIIYTRPNLEEIIRTISPSRLYFCGSPNVQKELSSLLKHHRGVDFYYESFD